MNKKPKIIDTEPLTTKEDLEPDAPKISKPSEPHDITETKEYQAGLEMLNIAYQHNHQEITR